MRSARNLPAVVAAALLASAVSTASIARAGDPPTISDCLTAAESSLKLRAEHKLQLTRTQLLVCASTSCPTEIRQECNKRIDEVNAAAPTLVLTVKDPTLKELTTVTVAVDGQVVTTHLDGSALNIDPGAHEFTFKANGQPVLTQTIILHEGEKDRRETVLLGGSTAPPSSTSETPAQGTTDTTPSTSAPGAGNGQRVAGLVIGGVGIAGLAAGGLFGILASSAWSSAKSECPSHSGCSAPATSDRSSALTDATLSTVGFIAGGALLVAGVTLYFTAPKSGSPQVGLEARPGGIAITGGF